MLLPDCVAGDGGGGSIISWGGPYTTLMVCDVEGCGVGWTSIEKDCGCCCGCCCCITTGTGSGGGPGRFG